MRNGEKNGEDKRAIEVENNEEQTINTRRTRGTAQGGRPGAGDGKCEELMLMQKRLHYKNEIITQCQN